MKACDKHAKKNELLDDSDIFCLKEIVDTNPNYYLNELVFHFGMTCGKFFHHSTIQKYLIEKSGYSMKVSDTVANRQCEMDEIRFLQALEVYLQSDTERLITIDETHKDRNAGRRRRCWKYKGNGAGVTIRTWFDNVARYTLLAAADFNGFILAACHTVRRDELLDNGAAGAVDGKYFLYWVKEYLCPILESY